MKKTTLITTLAAAGSLLVLVGCTGSGGGPDISDYSTACMFEVDPPGSYVWSDGDTEVKPGGGATAEGAAEMNACIREKAAAAGVSLTEPRPMSSQTTEVEQSGGMTVETFTYGQPPAAATSAATGSDTGQTCTNRNVLSGGSGYYGCSR